MWRRHRRRGDEGDEAGEGLLRASRAAGPVSLPGNPAEMLAAARDADRATVARLIGDLEEHAGNEAVGRLVGAAPAQRPGATEVDDEEEVGETPDVPAEDVARLGEDESPVAEPPTPTRSGTDIQVVEADPFPVTGTLRQVAGELAARTEAGSVTSQVADVYYEAADENSPTRLVAITVVETRCMPAWTNRAERPEAEQREWDRFYAALLAHEQRHIDIDREVFANLHRACLRTSIARMNEIIDEAIENANVRNRDFDTTTDHGRNAGTRIAPPPEEEAAPEGAAGPPHAEEPLPRVEEAPTAP